jgi:hypothetical protein
MPLIIFAIVEIILFVIALAGHKVCKFIERDYQLRRKLLATNSGNADDDEQTSSEMIRNASIYRLDSVILKYLNPNVPIYVRFVCNVVQLILSTMMCVMFVDQVGSKQDRVIWNIASVVCGVFFFIDYGIRGASFDSDAVYKYTIKFSAILDLLSTISILYSYNYWLSFAFFRVWIIVVTLIEMKELFTEYVLKISTVYTQIIILAIETIALIFIFASIILIFETLGPLPFTDDYDPSELNMFTSIYFIFITLASVGYGDFTVKTILGRVSIIFFVVSGVVVFTYNTTRILTLTQESKSGFGKFKQKSGQNFIIVSGYPHLESLKRFLDDMISREHLLKHLKSNFHIVVLMRGDHDFLEGFNRYLFSNYKIRRRVTFVNGSPLVQNDLTKRIIAEHADAVFILSNPFSPDTSMDDTANIFRAISVRRIVPDVPIYMNIASTSLRSLFSASDLGLQSCVFSTVLKMDVMAISCQAPGFGLFLYTILKEFEFDSASSECQNFKQYKSGLMKSVYTVQIDSSYVGMSLGGVCREVYRKYNGKVLVFGVGNPSMSDSGDWTNISYSFDLKTQIFKDALIIVLASDQTEVVELGYSISSEVNKILNEENAYSTVNSLYGMLKSPTIPPETNFYTLKQSQSFKQTRSLNPIPDIIPLRKLERVKSMSRKIIVPRDSPSEEDQREMKKRVDFENDLIDQMINGNDEKQEEEKLFIPPPPKDICSHIIVICSSTKDIGYFIRRIRLMEKERTKREILIISETDYKISHFLHIKSEYLQKVYFLKTKFKETRDFKKVNLVESYRIIVLSLKPKNNENSSFSDELIDSQTSLMWLRIKSYLAYKRISKKSSNFSTPIAELISENSLKFIDNQHVNLL